MRVVVDYDLCESNALCMAAAPEVFEVRDDDFLYVLQDEPARGAAGEGRGGRAPLPQAGHHHRGLSERRTLARGPRPHRRRRGLAGRAAGRRGAAHAGASTARITHRRRRAAPALRPAAAVEAGAGRHEAARVAPRSSVVHGTLDDLDLDWRLGQSATGLDLAERAGAPRRRRAARRSTAW